MLTCLPRATWIGLVVAAGAAVHGGSACDVSDGPLFVDLCDVDDDCAKEERCETDDIQLDGHAGYCTPADPPSVCLADHEPACDAGPLLPGDGSFTLARCALNAADIGGEAATFCTIGERPFTVACSFQGELHGSCAGECNGDEVTVSADGAAAVICRDPAFFGSFMCSLCFAQPPASLAISFDDDGNGADRACVDTTSCLEAAP